MIDFFTTLLTPLFITLGLVSNTPEPIIQPEISQQEQIVQLQESIEELESEEEEAQNVVEVEPTPKKVETSTQVKVVNEEKPKIDLEKYKLDTNDDIESKVIQKLNNDIYDLSVMRDVVTETRDKHIAQAEVSAEFKAESLDELATLFSDREQKEYVRNRADTFSQHERNASSSYSELYGYLIDGVVKKKSELQQLRNSIAENTYSGNVDMSLGISDEEYFAYISRFEETDEAFFGSEERYEQLFSDAMSSIRDIASWDETSSNLSDKLREIEDKANNSTIMDANEEYCWSTTNYEGGLINGTFETSTICR